MPKIIAFASGKGGVGKTTLTAMVGATIASYDKKVLIMEFDSGLRGLDILLGVAQDVVFDVSDAIEGRCELADAPRRSKLYKNLFLIPASSDADYVPDLGKLAKVVESYAESYDYILFDCPAGVGKNVLTVAGVAESYFLIVPPEAICIRDAALLGQRLASNGHKNGRLIINKVKKKGDKLNQITNFDWIIDQVGLQLIGVVPYDKQLTKVYRKDLGYQIDNLIEISNISKRIMGDYIPLSIR